MFYAVMRGPEGYSLESRATAEEIEALAREGRLKVISAVQSQEKAQKLLAKMQARLEARS